MKTLFVLAFLIIHSCIANRPTLEPSIISLTYHDFVVGQGDTLVINTSDLIGHTLAFVEYEDERGCATGCDINKTVRKIEYSEYSIVYDPDRYHGLLLDGDLVKCISKKEKH